ncbi:SGNH/GDSL hydrolase family protein [Methanosphaera sp. BMS]|uniref:SGNH/GDSL hydrolase family protein n=1 Tax=Methanosphaera sp. BMS TaxID=1789762 RepID=UPI000DC1CF35|nr:SGNH/GDSL hydrolase family protein [Methanosphaera sp. BMS]AWX32298.1 hypothetical protein AW729_03890 [Methanosphaera sp. BMS]
MEYLKNINDKLKKINEENVTYINLMEHPEFFYGNVNFSDTLVNFSKVPKKTREDITIYGKNVTKSMNDFHHASMGNRLRFETNSKIVILKIKLRRKWGFIKILNWNGLGFDIYHVTEDGKYVHKTVFGPKDGYSTFAEKIHVPSNGKICIFLPSYNTVEQIFLGFENNSQIQPLEYPEPQLPIIFYGNSVTQGSAASRSGNCFPNIVSRTLNKDIINLSVTNCCKGLLGMARMIGKLNCEAIIIDYTRNATDKEMFDKSYERFYKLLRKYHPNKLIILMTSSCYNYWPMCDEFDKIVLNTFNKAIENGDNTKLLNQRELFDDDEYDLVAVDSAHYTDYGMFKVANKICEMLTK